MYMLPFLKNKNKMAGSISETYSEDKGIRMDEEPNHALMSAAEDILRAVANKDAGQLANALQAAFEICEEMPHEESPQE